MARLLAIEGHRGEKKRWNIKPVLFAFQQPKEETLRKLEEKVELK